MKILITGFDPFGDYKVNPSAIVAEKVAKDVLAEDINIDASYAILPVSFKRARELLEKLFNEYKPDIHIALGLRPGASFIAVERVAINIMDSRIPDNDGYQPIDEPIDPQGSLAYFSTLPIKAIVKRLRESGIPATISNSAGTYLCNYVMYLSLHNSARFGIPKRAGFIHIPLPPEEAANRRDLSIGIPPSMSIDLAAKAIKIAVKTAVEYFNKPDERVPP